jgi:pimeloyl-ACP methyl ester carboxylesterase
MDTVLLLHSSASSARQWDALAALLAPHFVVHAIDLHGHGAQPAWVGAAPLTLADEAALALPLMRGAQRVHLVGHSYGGVVALKLAALLPQVVKSVVVYEPVAFRLLFEDAASRAEAADVLALVIDLRIHLAHGDPVAAAQRFIAYWAGAAAWSTMPAARRDAVAARMPSVLRHFDAVFAERPVRPLGATLCLSGADTVASTRRVGQLLRRALPQAAHERLPGMGHMGPLTHAQAVNRRIADFLFLDAGHTRAPAPARTPQPAALSLA